VETVGTEDVVLLVTWAGVEVRVERVVTGAGGAVVRGGGGAWVE
jgi:hypothetical protein